MKRLLTIPLVLLTTACLAQNVNKTLSLKNCREMAVESSEDLQKADNDIQKAELDMKIAEMSNRPMVDGSLTGLYTKDMEIMGNELQLRGMYLAGITVQQPIYTGGQITAGKRLAKIGKECAEEMKRKTRADIIAQTDEAYYSLLAVDEKVKMLEAFQKQLQGLNDRVSVSIKAQMATKNDLLRVQAKQSEIDYQIQKAKNGRQLCRIYLCNIIGVPLDTEITLSDTAIDVTMPHDLIDDVTNRPETNLLLKAMAAGEHHIKMAKSNYLPKVGLQLGYSYHGNIWLKGMTMLPDGTPYSYKQQYKGGTPMAMLGVQIPIFHWKNEIRKVKKAELDWANAQLDYNKNTKLMEIEARQAVQNYTDSYRMVQTAVIGNQQADENLRVMRNKYDNGMATMTDLLEAQALWQQARSNLIEAQTQYKISETRYLKAIGRL